MGSKIVSFHMFTPQRLPSNWIKLMRRCNSESIRIYHRRHNITKKMDKNETKNPRMLFLKICLISVTPYTGEVDVALKKSKNTEQTGNSRWGTPLMVGQLTRGTSLTHYPSNQDAHLFQLLSAKKMRISDAHLMRIWCASFDAHQRCASDAHLLVLKCASFYP